MITMTRKKSARVKTIKDNIEVGSVFPSPKNDGDVGHWVDQTLESKGHTVDKNGLLDLPEYGMDNKTEKQGSKSATTIGSMTKKNIKSESNWYKTDFYKKAKNHNCIKWDSDFNQVVDVKSIDLELDYIQEKLSEAYTDLRNRFIQDHKTGCEKKNYVSKNGWGIFDGYVCKNSYRFRIPKTAMNKIKNISATRDTFQKHFEIEK